MAEKIRLKFPSSVAALIQPGASSDEKIKGLMTAVESAPAYLVVLIFSLMNDSDLVVKSAAAVAFGELSEELLLEFIRQPAQHPAILDAIVRHHRDNLTIVAALLVSEALSPPAREYLGRVLAAQPTADAVAGHDGQLTEEEELQAQQQLDDLVENDENPEADSCQPVEEEDPEDFEEKEEFLSKYKMCQLMGISEKIKMALSGDKEWRSILIKDANKLVSGSVIKNPRLTDGEILTLLKAGVQNDEIMRLICANKEWIKNYLIRKALVENPRTPVPNALRYLSTLGDKDVANYAKSKNISSVVSTQAKRMLLSKKR